MNQQEDNNGLYMLASEIIRNETGLYMVRCMSDNNCYGLEKEYALLNADTVVEKIRKALSESRLKSDFLVDYFNKTIYVSIPNQSQPLTADRFYTGRMGE